MMTLGVCRATVNLLRVLPRTVVVAFLVLIVVLLIRPQGIFAEVASQKEVAT
jgi:branched-subunit amino acid ABC-type transport system permease component